MREGTRSARSGHAAGTFTLPAQQYSVNGERRSFALLWPTVDASAQERLRDVILDGYREHEAAVAEASA